VKTTHDSNDLAQAFMLACIASVKR